MRWTRFLFTPIFTWTTAARILKEIDGLEDLKKRMAGHSAADTIDIVKLHLHHRIGKHLGMKP